VSDSKLYVSGHGDRPLRGPWLQSDEELLQHGWNLLQGQEHPDDVPGRLQKEMLRRQVGQEVRAELPETLLQEVVT